MIDYDVQLMPSGRAGTWELTVKNGAAVPWTDQVRPARDRDRRRVLDAVRALHPEIDVEQVEARLCEAAASDRKSRVRKRAPRKLGAEPFEQRLTDIANAARFAAQHADKVRFIKGLGGWHRWDGRRWLHDETGYVERLARDTQRSILSEAAAEADLERQKALTQHAFKTAARPRLLAMLELAKSEAALVVREADVDGDPWVLNVLNGTLDLQAAELRPHDRADLITKLAPVEYRPEAQSARWDRFIADSMGGDCEVLAFLRRALGYSLSGDTSEEKLLLIHGSPASGKSTLLSAFGNMLGDYARVADAESFVARKHGGGPRDDIARLVGCRFVASVEIDEGRKLAEGLVKQLTGGDTIVARRLYCDAFEFKPTFKLWIAANHAPRVSNRDAAMWRRIVRLPFDQTVPEEKRDRTLKEELTDPARSGAAILAWSVQGFAEWRKRGLDVPDSVREATDAYRSEQDPLRRFLEDACVLLPTAWTSAEDLRRTYLEWAEGDRYVVSTNEFAERLQDLGCTQKWRRAGAPKSRRGWQGIGIRTGDQLDGGAE